MIEAEEVVRRVVNGDEQAFGQLVRQWETRVYNLAWRFLGNREDAQDVAQETFLSVFKSIRFLREPASFRTWLYRIALNHCRAHWRSRVPDISLDEPAPGQDGEALEPAIVLRYEGQDALETMDMIRKALSGVSEQHKAAIILKEYLGLNLEEVAAVMECPLSTAKSRLYHGLRDVQRNLKRLRTADFGARARKAPQA